MKDFDIAVEVDRGQELTLLIDIYTAERKAIEAHLIAVALARPEDHVALEDPEREGKQFLATGIDHTIPIVITADQITASFQKDSVIHKKLTDLAPKLFSRFFKPISGFKCFAKDGKKFRALARELLGEEAPEFITASLKRDKFGVPKNQIKVMWARAKDAEGDEESEGEEEAS